LLFDFRADFARAFEQDQRINALFQQFTTDVFAAHNAFGQAFTGMAQSQLQTSINNSIADGSISLLFTMPGLTDLTGVNAPSLQMGVVNAQPTIDPANPTSYSGASDLDWWYTAKAAEVDSQGVPTNQVPGSIAARNLSAGPGRLFLAGLFGGSNGLELSTVLLQANVGSSSPPLQSTNNFPPGHLPSENLDTQLVSFASMSVGKLKGNISAASLAATPIPASFIGNTTEGYTSANSMLDILVSGAHVLFVTVVNATQPDQVDPGAPVAGAGGPYTFTVNATKMVTGCLDKNNVAVDLAAGLNAAAYSAYFTFTSDRVIHQLPPPEIAVQQPAGTNLVDGASTIDYGVVLIGSPAIRTFSITNTGGSDLANLAITFDGAAAADFSVTVPPVAPVVAHGSTSFTVRFAPTVGGARSAALHIASNVSGSDNPFDIALTGHALAPNGDDDGDGLSNLAEMNLSSLGFDPLVDNTPLISLLRSNGLYRAVDMQTLALGAPLLGKDQNTGHFHLILGVEKSADLQTWSPLTGFSPAFDPLTGRIDLEFAPEATNTEFFRLLGAKP
jgi:hypothetical protein